MNSLKLDSSTVVSSTVVSSTVVSSSGNSYPASSPTTQFSTAALVAKRYLATQGSPSEGTSRADFLGNTPSEEVLAFAEGEERRRLLWFIARSMGRTLRGFLEPEDILQEVLMTAYREPDAFWACTQPEERRAWLQSIARHRILRSARDLRPRSRPRRGTAVPPTMLGHPEGAVELPELLADAASEPPDRVQRREHRESICQALARLDGQRRTQIVLRTLLGASWPVICFLTDRQPEAARKLHQRCLRDLGNHAP